MEAIMTFLNGKKTYIVAVLFGVYNVGLALGYWAHDSGLITAINGVLASFGFGFLRSGVGKSGPQ